jgi:hypothetical protein
VVRIRGRGRDWIVAGAVAVLFAAALVVIGRVDVVRTLTRADIDGYPARTKVSACADPLVGKSGVVAFRDLILSQVGGGDDGLAVCKHVANESGSYSDHADGRAWDWRVRASSPTDRAMVDRVLNWLMRTDDRGRRNAMARRIGITYVIWNHRYYRVGGNDAHWVPYTGTRDPHDTHVHFSFSVAGATRQTSWWKERGPLVWSLSNAPDISLVFGAGPARPLAGDWDGDGRDTLGLYDPADRKFSLRDATPSGDPDVTTPPIGRFGATPFVGDWDGVGRDEVGVYEPLTRRFSFYSSTGAQGRPSQVFGATGDLPIIGDWDGDRVDDIGTYSPGSQTFSLLLPDGSVRTETFGSVNDTPVVGDWNGDGADDIGVFRSSSHRFLLATRSADGTQVIRSMKFGTTGDVPVIGDWDGNGADDRGTVTTG